MEVQSASVVSFGSYQNVLKTLFKKGKMPQVKRGLYGDLINVNNVSLEHLKPHSQGGQTVLSNLALASKAKNSARGTRPLDEVLNWEMVNDYLSQFNFRIKGFNGENYIRMIRKTVRELGVIDPREKAAIERVRSRMKKLDVTG